MNTFHSSIAVSAPALLVAMLLSCANAGEGAPAPGDPGAPYHRARSKALRGSRAGFGLPETGHPVWAWSRGCRGTRP